MEVFVKIINGRKSLSLFAKTSIFGIWVLNTPMIDTKCIKDIILVYMTKIA